MPELTETARFAIEEVCSGRRLDDLDHCYAPNFVDHVNAMEHRGHDGVREWVGLYKRIFDDLSFTTEQQVAEGDRDVTHWTLRDSYCGWQVEFSGVVISRFEDGRIAEDWAFSDSIEVTKQLGVWRSALIVMKEWRALLG